MAQIKDFFNSQLGTYVLGLLITLLAYSQNFLGTETHLPEWLALLAPIIIIVLAQVHDDLIRYMQHQHELLDKQIEASKPPLPPGPEQNQ